MKKEAYKKADLNKVVTLGVLLEYTEDFLIPKIGDIVTDVVERIVPPMIDKSISKANGELKHELKEYIDKKLNDYTTDIFKKLDKKYEKEKQFKEKIVELFKKHKIGTSEDLAFLDGLVSGS